MHSILLQIGSRFGGFYKIWAAFKKSNIDEYSLFLNNSNISQILAIIIYVQYLLAILFF